jgi:hypothetical protein
MKSAPAALAALALASAPLPAAPADVRTGPLKDLNGYFPFSPPASTETWQTRRAALQLQTQIALGLHPLPEKTPLNPSTDGRITGDGFTVERVRFESFPGFFVTGSLFRPTTPSPTRNPAVLCPHGHWNNGRFLSEPENDIATSIKSGAETTHDNARSPLQARCITLARMGCTVFFYDMIGYADSIQLSYELAHRFKTQRPAMNDPENWGFFSPQAEGHLHSIMGLQTWNSIRALDFLCSLPDVDPARIGVTGASGGGTQTFILGAIDPRPAALFPCVMVSTAMQGGCTCENASLLRIETGNVELAALFAPKPLGMTAANDWTKEMKTKGFPQLKQLYSLLGKPDHVMLHDRTEFGHNYNLPSRMAMYRWFASHLQTPRPAPETEAPIQYLSQNDLTVWTGNHPSPKPDDASLERQILQHWHKDTSRQIAANPQFVTDALPTIVGRSWDKAGQTTWEQGERSQQNGYLEMKGHIVNSSHREAVAATFLYPTAWNGTVKVLLQSPDPATAASTAQSGTAICFPTLFTEPAPGTPATARHVEGDRDFAGYTHGYNHGVIKRRAHDILTTLAFISSHERKPSRIEVHADADFVPETALALALVPTSAVASATFAETTFRFADIKDIRSPKLVPGILRYGDLPALLAKAKR